MTIDDINKQNEIEMWCHEWAKCRYDARVRDLLDFSIYLDISNEVKFAWKIQVTCLPPSPPLLINPTNFIKIFTQPLFPCLRVEGHG